MRWVANTNPVSSGIWALSTVLSMITGLVSETLVVMRNSCRNKVIEENLLLLPIKRVLPFLSIFVSGGLLKRRKHIISVFSKDDKHYLE